MDQTANPHAPLLRGISQYDVDFVIPRIGVDTPVGIDPFLLYKSRDAEYRQLHALLLAPLGVPREVAVAVSLLFFGHLLVSSLFGAGFWIQSRPLRGRPAAPLGT